jgi:membrane fusion protein (multidrug efflux system)
MKTINQRTKIFITSIGVLLVAFLVISSFVLSGKSESPEAEKAIAPAAPPAVLTDAYIVKKSELEDEIQTTGSVIADQEVALVTEVARKVTGIYAKEGSFVKKGALLFKLDDADLLAKKKKLQLQERLALLDEKRFRELLSTEAVNQQEYDEISTKLKVLQAEIELINVDLSKTEIRAPFDGKVGLSKVDVGDYVTPSSVLTNIEGVSKVEINFTIPEKYATDIHVGQRILFATENNATESEAVISATEPATDLDTRSLSVKAIADNKAGRFVPGSSAKIRLSLKKIEDGIIVPTQALIPTQQGYSLFAVKNGVADYRVVKTGARNKATIRILEGLAHGDTVITSNLLRLGPGVPVQLAKVE